MASILDCKRYCDSMEKCADCNCRYFCENKICDCTDQTIKEVNSTINTWLKTHPAPSYLDELVRRMPALKGREKEFINKTCVEMMFDTKVKESSSACLAGNCFNCWRKDYKGEK